jgi:hypothetical protein
MNYSIEQNAAFRDVGPVGPLSSIVALVYTIVRSVYILLDFNNARELIEMA